MTLLLHFRKVVLLTVYLTVTFICLASLEKELEIWEEKILLGKVS